MTHQNTPSCTLHQHSVALRFADKNKDIPFLDDGVSVSSSTVHSLNYEDSDNNNTISPIDMSFDIPSTGGAAESSPIEHGPQMETVSPHDMHRYILHYTSKGTNEPCINYNVFTKEENIPDIQTAPITSCCVRSNHLENLRNEQAYGTLSKNNDTEHT